jgi:DNA-directed RNA polymerase specialized sigma24 family protein
MNAVLQYIRGIAVLRDATGLSDGQLLERYVTCRDEAAFEALLRRHAPMVLGVCRRVLDDSHEVRDAFQATFLVLVRNAGTVLPRDMVGDFLYGVAQKTTLRARRRDRGRSHSGG